MHISALRSAISDFQLFRTRLFRQQLLASPDAIDLQALQQHIDRLETKLLEAEDLQRVATAARRNFAPQIKSFDDTGRLDISVMSPSAPWLTVTPVPVTSPAMISREEAQYYTYIGAFYQGLGRAVELGPWLGASTQHIVRSLARNPNFQGQKLYVVDDFVWRSEWMNPYMSEEQKLPNHVCFRHLFDNYTSGIRELLTVQKARLTIYDGNENVDPFVWGGEPIELLYVDCGRTITANEAWYECLHRAFLPGRTLLMMQDWRLHRERPRRNYNQTNIFSEGKGSELELLHEVSNGGLATFLFHG